MSKDNFEYKKHITTTSELYGVDSKIFRDMKYIDVLNLKIKLANDLISDLLSVHFMHRDNNLIMKITKAIQFNEELLKEL